MKETVMVRRTARELIKAQRKMLDRYSEGDTAVRQRLWSDLHRAGDALDVALDAEDRALARLREADFDGLSLREFADLMQAPVLIWPQPEPEPSNVVRFPRLGKRVGWVRRLLWRRA